MENTNEIKRTSTYDHLKIMCLTGEKKYTITCECCDHVDVVYRRDINYKLTTFLLALRDLMNVTNTEYHNYNDILAYCREYYKTNPTDYSLLETKWLLIKGEDNKKGQRMKTLTSAGYYFLNNDLKVSINHYQDPNSDKILWSKKKTYLGEILQKHIESKKINEPFFNK